MNLSNRTLYCKMEDAPSGPMEPTGLSVPLQLLDLMELPMDLSMPPDITTKI